jgi:hypothetical protein
MDPVEDTDACLTVREADSHALAYVYFADCKKAPTNR